MASIEEIALGITALLVNSSAPEPLAIELRNETVQGAMRLVSLVITECVDAERHIALVRIDSELAAAVNQRAMEQPSRYKGSKIEAVKNMGEWIEFYRSEPSR